MAHQTTNNAALVQGNAAKVQLNNSKVNNYSGTATEDSEDPETMKLKVKLNELLPETPAKIIDKLMEDLENAGIYSVNDLGEIADIPEKITSVGEVLKKKFIKAVEELRATDGKRDTVEDAKKPEEEPAEQIELR